MMLSILQIIASLTQMGADLTGSQRRYLKWRHSRRGRKYFEVEEENKFYRALEHGDTSVIDVGIREKQLRIKSLRRTLGSWFCLICICAGLSGCAMWRIPTSDLPAVTVETLTANERSYVVEDMVVSVEGKREELRGTYYVVHPDFIRMFRRNQDDTIAALERLAFTLRWILPGVGIVAFALGILVLLAVVKIAGTKPG